MRNYYDDISWSFLISSPSHSGDFFEESVVLLLEDNEDGAFGIAINKPGGKKARRNIRRVRIDPVGGCRNIRRRAGGQGDRQHRGLLPRRRMRMRGQFFLRDDHAKRDRGNFQQSRCESRGIFRILGWAPKQLQSEISEGEWIVSNADIGAIFEIPAEDIWRELLIRERPEYAALERPKSPPSLN